MNKTFKFARVTPILKKHDLPPLDPSSYRPISILSSISKLFEKLVLSRLAPHLALSPNLDPRQSAYTKGLSTETSVLGFINDLHSIVARGSAAALISLDLSAAFDVIDHEILLCRLESDFGLCDLVLSWFRSYLDGRSQMICVGSSESSIAECPFGVPQGSVLGPLLFSLYTSPVSSVIESCGALHSSYADDVNVISSISSSSTACAAEAATHELRLWYGSNGMLLNSSKSEAVIVGTRSQRSKFPLNPTISVAGSFILSKGSIKSLGISIDSDLSLDKWVSSMVSSCNYHLRAFRHIRPVLSLELAKTVGCAIILSRLDYCNSTLASTSKHNIDSLQIVQNQCARIIFKLPYRSSVRVALKELHWLPVRERIEFKILVLTFSILSTGTPGYLRNLLELYVPTRALRSSADNRRLVVPLARTALVAKSFSIAAPTLWNNLPLHIRSSDTLSSFKSSLKTFLFSKAYDD